MAYGSRRWWPLLIAGVWPGSAVAAATEAAPPIRYVGHRYFPPYEYLGRDGQPRGFNVDLLQAISREAGRAIEVRLEPWERALADLAEGRADLMSLGHSQARTEQFDYLAEIRRLRQALVFRPRSEAYPRRLDEAQMETVAVGRASLMYDLLFALPEVRRPVLRVVDTQGEALDQLAAGEATAAAGNALTLLFAARERGMTGLVEVPVKSLTYHLATRRGRAAEFGWVAPALAAVHASGEYDRLVEAHLVPPPQPFGLGAFRTPLLAGLGVLVAGLVAAVGWTGLLRARVRAETAKLKATERRYRDLFEATPHATFVYDVESLRILDANAAAQRLYGYTHDEMLGLRLLDLHDPKDLPALGEVRFAELPPFKEGRWTHRRRDGMPLDVETSSHAMVLGQSQARCVVVTDVTERNRIQRFKDGLISVAAHELRNPLTTIFGALDWIAHVAPGIGPREQEMAAIGAEASARMARLIRDVLDVEKAEAGQLPLRTQRVDVVEVARQAVQASRSLAEPLCVGLALEAAQPVVWVLADPDRLVQVLSNLISNAVKFSPAGETVTLTLSRQGAAARVEVRDRGPGIPEGFQKRIFQKFAQAREHGSRHQGTGLGLAISKALVEQMGGRIGFETREGQGTTFHFELPLTSAGEDAA